MELPPNTLLAHLEDQSMSDGPMVPTMSSNVSDLGELPKNGTHKRPVARRACLSCREKKIKCDGETQLLKAPDRPPVCSNCRFLGIDCVFVQSMRGGRRRKRMLDKPDSGPDKYLKLNEQARKDSSGLGLAENVLPPPLASLGNSQNRHMVDDSFKLKLPSPTLLYLSFADGPHKLFRPLYEHSESSSSGYMYEYPPGPFPPGGPPPYGFKHGHKHHRRGDRHGLDHPFHHGPGMHLPPYGHGPPLHHFPPPPPPPHVVYRMGEYYYPPHGQPPPPPPHMLYGLPPPQGPPTSSHGESQDGKSVRGSVKGLEIAYFPRGSDVMSAHMKSLGTDSTYWQKASTDAAKVPSVASSSSHGNKMNFAPSDAKKYKATESSSTSSMSLPESAAVSEQVTEAAYPARLSGPESPKSVVLKRSGSGSSFEPFRDDELQRYNLPPWRILSDVFDFYFMYVNPNFVLLPNKDFFLKRLALNSDSSIVHAIIAVVCTKRSWPFEQDESHWIKEMYRFWDDLNDFGMLLCFTLIQQTSHIRDNFHNLVEVNDKMYEIIQSNHYLDVVLTSTSLNARKQFENEAIIRMIWIYWMESLIFRLRQGHPYSKLFMMRNDNVLVGSGVAELSNRNLPFPIPNESYVKCQNSRRLTWDDLNKGICEDSSTPIKAALILHQVMERIAANELTEDNLVLEPQFRNLLKTRFYLVKEDTLILNAHYVIANFLNLCAGIIQRCHFINHLLAFEALMRSTMKVDGLRSEIDGSDSYIPRLNAFSINKLINLEELPTHIAELNDFKWSCLIELISDTMSIVDLINVHLGIIPSETKPRFSVLYGVTSLDASRDWFMSKELITSGESTWLKASDFSVFTACLLISIIPSLIVLRNLFEIKTEGSKSKAVMLRTGQVYEFDVEVAPKIEAYFNKDSLVNSFERVLEFIKYRAQYDQLRSLQQGTITNINKVSHYMEEILQNMK